jgi:hypothetical protein
MMSRFYVKCMGCADCPNRVWAGKGDGFMASVTRVSALKQTLNRPVGGGVVFLAAAVTYLVVAHVCTRGYLMPGDPELELNLRIGAYLLGAAIVLQRRDLGLWPFSVPVIRKSVDRVVCPAMRLLVIPWRVCFALLIILSGFILVYALPTLVVLVYDALNAAAKALFHFP